jgi:hypothetical protein
VFIDHFVICEAENLGGCIQGVLVTKPALLLLSQFPFPSFCVLQDLLSVVIIISKLSVLPSSLSLYNVKNNKGLTKMLR